ncbi:MAG: S1C family serine protease [Planctomycetaceae bacterium]
MMPIAARCVWGMVLVVAIATVADAAAESTPQRTAAAAAKRVVKLYGAGGIRGLEAYQSGIVISPAGRILTVMSTVLDADTVTCVFDDGRRREARVVGIDPRRELAVLEVDEDELPSFALAPRPRARAGMRVMAVSNLFGVAAGDERVSVQRGVVSAVVPLEARRGAAEAPYSGAAYLVDCTTSNPGAAGGALVDARGDLVGMLGKEARSTASGIWLNYALPVDELLLGVDGILAGAPPSPVVAAERPRFDLRGLGLGLVPDLLDRTPPFVDSVQPGSRAAAAGIRPDDLVIVVGGRAVASRAAVEEAVAAIPTGERVGLTLIRDGALVEIDLGPRPRDGATP